VSLRILVIRRDNIGDLVCTTPLLAALRARHPDAHIAALVNSYNAGVLEGNPDVDAIHSYTKLKHRGEGESWWSVLVHRYRMIAALRRAGFDYVLLGKSTFDRHGLALARQVRPRHIVGIPPDAGQRAAGITDPVAPASFAQGHEVEAIMKLGAPLGVDTAPGPAPCSPRPRAWPNGAAASRRSPSPAPSPGSRSTSARATRAASGRSSASSSLRAPWRAQAR